MTRPQWSVMLPVYDPDHYLADALGSVLCQHPGPGRMHVEVIDDASPRVAVEPLVGRLGSGRVGYWRQPANRGLAGNWNTCTDRAVGDYVHILHQDDAVEPGFYDALAAGFAADPGVGMAFCRHRCVNADGRTKWVSEDERATAGVVDGWVDRIAVRQRVQCPAVAVRRDVYAAVGGFRADLRYLLDWEMWVRIAARYRVWYDPRVLATYRQHPASETARLTTAGRVDADFDRVFPVLSRHLPADRAALLVRAARRARGGDVMEEAYRELEAGRIGAAVGRLWVAVRVARQPAYARQFARVLLGGRGPAADRRGGA